MPMGNLENEGLTLANLPKDIIRTIFTMADPNIQSIGLGLIFHNSHWAFLDIISSIHQLRFVFWKRGSEMKLHSIDIIDCFNATRRVMSRTKLESRLAQCTTIDTLVLSSLSFPFQNLDVKSNIVECIGNRSVHRLRVSELSSFDQSCRFHC
ncbi:hypothetical protein PMAYCL1PPCAC_28401 [Pristionchus mayeri]|uniref:Uncharacterized protein n=1 Tax=Pristionchus mayeri TaxID=1317129 RepID=A0AAN5D7F7_9BILA|nr:hypothetical protein PMAYCL1PPCAC_28401 [Pristionchus mayeri]